MTTYDPRNMEWDYYCALMNELFAGNQLGTVPEREWRSWVDALVGIGYFSNSNVPDSKSYLSWQAWAENMVGIMSLEN
jgi:hypothetical protein